MDELDPRTDAPQAPEKKKPAARGFDNRRKILYAACGAYLLYLAYQMAQEYPKLAAEGVWTSGRIIDLVGAIFFALTGITLLVIVGVHGYREGKETAQNQQNGGNDDE